MDFRIADTFLDSLRRLPVDEQKLAKLTTFDMQADPSLPSLQLHRIDRSKDKNFWSVRIDSDLRIVVHRSGADLLVCYAGHHEEAYDWARRRRIDAHPVTGAAQIVLLEERVEASTVARAAEATPAKPTRKVAASRPFAKLTDATLLSYGVPAEWTERIRTATEDVFLDFTDQLPGEASEALLDVISGRPPEVRAPITNRSPFDHPDAQRRFRGVKDQSELARALEFPWDKWALFLHPSQREAVESDYKGATRISGTAGTGKTIVALHRAVYLARANEGARVLLTTGTATLANALKLRLLRLVEREPRLADQVEVLALNSVANRLYTPLFGKPAIAARDVVRDHIEDAANAEGRPYRLAFLVDEWDHVIDAWQVDSWESYRDVPRLGRKTRLGEKQRMALWALFARVRQSLAKTNFVTWAQVYTRVTNHVVASDKSPFAFDYLVMDEAQDVSVPQLRLLAALAGGRPNALFLTGDLGQRIFQQPFSWKALGVDVRGRSKTLRINYRTSHQIRTMADRLLPPTLSDVDQIPDSRLGAQSVFEGPEPTVHLADDEAAEQVHVATWLAERVAGGVASGEIGVFVRSDAQLARARAAIELAGLSCHVLDNSMEVPDTAVTVSTMHLAKGLEFRAVVVMACDEEVVPLQARIAELGDEADLESILETEKHLLYVACTRARDFLLVTAVAPGSEYLEDLGAG